MKKYSLGALVAAGLLVGGLTASSASAADLGGNCCADLEERIAELEATTARKGNRKVSLTVSGWVGEQILGFDNGKETNVYVTGLGTTLASHVKFTGQATISPGWYAGYVLQIEADENDPLFLDENHSTNSGAGVNVLQTFWFVKSDKLGKVSVGKQSAAGDNAAILVDGSGSLVPSNWVEFDNASFHIFHNGVGINGLVWGSLGQCNTVNAGIGGDCVGVPQNLVRYDSPVFAGFSVSADWGEDDYWDVYGRYAGEWNGIKVAATTGWSEATQCGGQSPAPADTCLNDPNNRITYWQSGLYVEHVATGVFAYGAYGREHLDNVNEPGLPNDPTHWMVKAGLRERWNPLGHTVVYGSYTERKDMIADAAEDTAVPGSGNEINNSKVREWGGGVVQEIDAAAMSVWLQYDHFDGDVSGGGASASLDTFQLVKFGALINF